MTSSSQSPAVTEELRPARESDAGELLVLQRACWMQEALDNDSMDIPALHEDLAAVLTDLAQWETWVLRRDGRLIARGVAAVPHWSWADAIDAAPLQTALLSAGIPIVRAPQPTFLATLPTAARGR